MKLTTVLIGLAAMAVSLPAVTINFAGGGLFGSSHNFGLVAATGYLNNGVTGALFGKGTAGDTGGEDGLGMHADPTGENEIYAKSATGAPANDFVQLDISKLSGSIYISMSSTAGDTWAVYGSNHAGIKGWNQLASGGGDDGSEVFVTTASSYKYLDVVALTNNVLVQDIEYTGTTTPEPGTVGIVGLGGMLIALLRRKRSQN